jgi:hypothetical protein
LQGHSAIGAGLHEEEGVQLRGEGGRADAVERHFTVSEGHKAAQAKDAHQQPVQQHKHGTDQGTDCLTYVKAAFLSDGYSHNVTFTETCNSIGIAHWTTGFLRKNAGQATP